MRYIFLFECLCCYLHLKCVCVLSVCVGLARPYIYGGAHTVIFAGISSNILSYTVYIYGFGQPYVCVLNASVSLALCQKSVSVLSVCVIMCLYLEHLCLKRVVQFDNALHASYEVATDFRHQ